jgi:hypothetical protein
VTDSFGAMASQGYSITVNLPPTIAGATLPLAAVNQTYPPFTIPVSNGTPAFAWTQTGTLPAGLTFANGVISGTATGGTFAPPYDVPGSWTAAGSNGGTTSLTPNCLATVNVTDAAGGSSAANFLVGSTPSSSCAAFGYAIDLNNPPGSGQGGSGVSARTWSFQSAAATSGTLTFSWQYVGFHSFFEVTALLQVFSGQSAITLYQPAQQNCCTSPSGGFNVSGTGTIAITAGTPFGFTVGGSNGDLDAVLSGTLYITNFVINGQLQPPTINGFGLTPSNQPQIAWISSVPSSGVTGFNVYRTTISGTGYTLVGTLPATATSFIDNNAQVGTTYFYVVTAVASGVESIFSNEVSVTTLSP